MSARDHSAGREVVQHADDCLHEGGSVQVYLRARQDPITPIRFSLGQFSVRMFTAAGPSYDVPYSAIEAVRQTRPSHFSATDC